MKFPALALVLFAVLAFCAAPAGAQDFSEVEFKTTSVAGNVHVLEGAGGNIGVSVGEDGVLLVDDQFAPLADKIRAAVAELGGGAMEFVLNTHWHGDHTGGNEVFGAEATLISHANVRKRLSVDHNLSRGDYPAKPEVAWPVITFEESLSIHFNGEEIRALHFPHAHTDGDAVIVFTGSRVIHMGDLAFRGLFPFIDLEAGGTVEGYTAAIKAVLAMATEEHKLIAGHGGPVITVAQINEDLAMLEATTAIVQEWIAEGKSLEQCTAAGLPDKYAGYDWGFIPEARWIETLYTDLSK